MADKKQNPHPNLISRVLPHNNEAEQAVLGCVLIDQYAPIHVLSELMEDDFYYPAHRFIFEAMRNIMHRDKPIDIVLLVQELDTMGMMEKAGGLTYLSTLTNIIPSASNYKHYCEIVKKNSILRKLIESAQRITDKAFEGDPDDSALKFAETEIYTLSEKLDKSSLTPIRVGLSTAVGRMETLFNNPDAMRGIPTGFSKLDEMLNGFQSSDLVLIAARPGQGKTSIGMNFIQHAAFDVKRRTDAGKQNPYRCAVFSLEMPASQLAKRMLCAVSKVSLKRANSGKLTGDDWEKIHRAKALLDRAEIYIDDSSLTTPVEILSKCRRLKREKGLDLVMVDYLQLMSVGKRVENRQQEISEITRTMKIAAKELEVPILMLSQMTREVEKRQGKQPQMSDLRESGAIEQDADIIMFIYRPSDASENPTEEDKSKVELIIAKHRNGETGKVELRWRGETVSFEDPLRTPGLEKSMPPPKNENSAFLNVATDEDFASNAINPVTDLSFVASPANEGEDGIEISKMSAEQIMSVKVDDDDDIF